MNLSKLSFARSILVLLASVVAIGSASVSSASAASADQPGINDAGRCRHFPDDGGLYLCLRYRILDGGAVIDVSLDKLGGPQRIGVVGITDPQGRSFEDGVQVIRAGTSMDMGIFRPSPTGGCWNGYASIGEVGRFETGCVNG